jgi:hypothetical protein
VTNGEAETEAPHATPGPTSSSDVDSDADTRGDDSPASEHKPRTTQTKATGTRTGRARPRTTAVPWLLSLFAGTVVGAALLYPHRTAVYRPGPLSVIVKLSDADVATAAAASVQMWVKPTATAHVFDMTFVAVYHGTKAAVGAHPVGGVTILLPPEAHAMNCAQTNAGGEHCSKGPGPLNDVTDLIYATALGENDWSATLKFTINSPALVWSSNGLIAEAQLPVVKGFSYQGSVPHAALNADTPVTVSYELPSASNYDWTGGPPPNTVSSYVGAWWTESLQALSTPIAVSGTDTSSASNDTIRTLIAGTFLGIAGAALVAAIQELVHRRDGMPSVETAGTGKPS